MAEKKITELSKLPFNELRDKAKEIEGFKKLNRFEIIQAVRKAENKPLDPNAEKTNPRNIKPEIVAAKAKLTEATDKKARKELRQQISQLKSQTRKYS